MAKSGKYICVDTGAHFKFADLYSLLDKLPNKG
jgi:hypothetical protein